MTEDDGLLRLARSEHDEQPNLLEQPDAAPEPDRRLDLVRVAVPGLARTGSPPGVTPGSGRPGTRTVDALRRRSSDESGHGASIGHGAPADVRPSQPLGAMVRRQTSTANVIRRDAGDVMYMDAEGVAHDEPQSVLYMDPEGVGHDAPNPLPDVLHMDAGGVGHASPRSALEEVLATKQARGPDFKPMGAFRGARKHAATAVRKERMAEVNALRKDRLVSTGDHAAVEGAVGAKQGKDDTYKPMSTVRAARGNRKRKAERAEHAEKSAKKTAEYEAFKSKSDEMADILRAGRAAMGTEDPIYEIGELDTVLAEEKWAAAMPILEQIKSISAAAIAAARSKLEARSADIAKVKAQPAYHQPPGLAAQEKAVTSGLVDAQWTTIDSAVRAFLETIDQAQDFETRFAVIEAQAEGLTNVGRKKTMTTWIAEHKSMAWEDVVASSENVYKAKGGLANLEDRLLSYQKDDAQVAASAKSADLAAAKANADAAAAREAAKALRLDRISKGLLAGNGTVIAERKSTDLTGPGETAAVQAALQALKDGTAIALTHPNGALREADHLNRDADLPGAKRSGGYTETYVQKDPASPTYHGSRRLVVHTATGRTYYSWTHYGANGSPAFVKLTD
jgi:hypothetical protein